MPSPLESATAFAHRMHEWLVVLDPASFEDAGVPDARAALQTVREEADELATALRSPPPELVRLAGDLDALRDVLPPPAEVPSEALGWIDLRVEVAPLYEAYAHAVKHAGGRARHLHPTNYSRSLVHLVSGLLVVAAFELVFTQWTGFLAALAFTIWAWSLEGARRVSPRVNRWCMWFFGPIARDHERHRVNSATWYGTALFVLSVTAYGPAGVLGLLSLAVGDPIAGLIGRSYGEIRIWGGKSLEGSVAFALASLTVGYVYLIGLHGTLGGPLFLLGLATLAGATGAIVELLSTRLEDNFTIPVVTAWVVQLALGWAN